MCVKYLIETSVRFCLENGSYTWMVGLIRRPSPLMLLVDQNGRSGNKFLLQATKALNEIMGTFLLFPIFLLAETKRAHFPGDKRTC